MIMLTHSPKALRSALLLTGIPLLSTISITHRVTANSTISLDQAALIARSSYPEGMIREIELEDGRWDIEFTDDSEVEIEASTGQVIEVDYKRQPQDPALIPNISLERAVAVARSRVPNSQMVELELGNDDERLSWEVEFSNDTKVEIDAQTGSVLKVEID